MEDPQLSIGEVARRTGLNASAIRFYEEAGLLPAPERSAGRRRYSEDVLARLGVIGVAKRAGLSLEEIRVLLDATDGGRPAGAALQELAARKLPEVETLIARAQAVRGWLAAAADCDCESFDVCALFAEHGELEPAGVLSGP